MRAFSLYVIYSGSGYESDSTLVFKRREDNQQTMMSPAEQRSLYKSIQKGGEVPFHGLRKAAPEKPKGENTIFEINFYYQKFFFVFS